jgi:hypothetical protein
MPKPAQRLQLCAEMNLVQLADGGCAGIAQLFPKDLECTLNAGNEVLAKVDFGESAMS